VGLGPILSPRALLAGVGGAVLMLSGCSHSDGPTTLADQTTKAVYALDVAGTEAGMDDDLRKQVTRASIGDLSDKMHALGGYVGLKPTTADPDKGRYAFEADFEHGILAVDLRLDPTGKIGAYRVSPASR
jgi:hypothetical protein